MGALCAFLFIAVYYDYQYRRIPNILLVLMFVVGMAQKWWLRDGSVVTFLLSAFVLIVLLYPFFKLGMLGAGDVKLLGICAGYLAYTKILHFLFFSMLIAAVFSLIKLIMDRNVAERLRYLGDYLLEVARNGRWKLYLENEKECRKAGIPLAGPVLCSVLLYIGGIY